MVAHAKKTYVARLRRICTLTILLASITGWPALAKDFVILSASAVAETGPEIDDIEVWLAIRENTPIPQSTQVQLLDASGTPR